MLRNMVLGLMLLGTPAMANGEQDPVAQDDSQKSATVRVEMLVVHATTKHTKVDVELKDIKKYFRNFKFTGYKLLKKRSTLITDKNSREFVIDGNRRVNIR